MYGNWQNPNFQESNIQSGGHQQQPQYGQTYPNSSQPYGHGTNRNNGAWHAPRPTPSKGKGQWGGPPTQSYGRSNDPVIPHTDSGGYEREADLVRLSLSHPKGEALREGNASLLCLPKPAYERLAAALHHIPLASSETEWAAWLAQVRQLPHTPSTDINQIWIAHGYTIKETAAMRERALHMQLVEFQKQQAEQQRQTQELQKSTLEILQRMSSMQGASQPRKKSKVTKKGQGDRMSDSEF